MAAAFKYKLPSFARFLVPLRRVYAGRIVLLTDSQTATLDIVRLCHEHGAELQSVASDRNVHVGRFALYAKVCNASYAWCFASDFRDVFFQANPFRVIPALQPQAELLLSEEYPGVRIGEERWNRGWVQSCFGHEGLKRIKTQQVICSGTIMGSQGASLSCAANFKNLVSSDTNAGSSGLIKAFSTISFIRAS
jgi:hypothetical protein